MSPILTIALMLAVCALLILVLFNIKAFKSLGRMCLRGMLGGAGVLAVNWLLGFANVTTGVGVNVLTVFFTAFLGIPGFVTLYMAQLFLPK